MSQRSPSSYTRRNRRSLLCLIALLVLYFTQKDTILYEIRWQIKSHQERQLLKRLLTAWPYSSSYSSSNYTEDLKIFSEWDEKSKERSLDLLFRRAIEGEKAEKSSALNLLNYCFQCFNSEKGRKRILKQMLYFLEDPKYTDQLPFLLTPLSLKTGLLPQETLDTLKKRFAPFSEKTPRDILNILFDLGVGYPEVLDLFLKLHSHPQATLRDEALVALETQKTLSGQILEILFNHLNDSDPRIAQRVRDLLESPSLKLDSSGVFLLRQSLFSAEKEIRYQSAEIAGRLCLQECLPALLRRVEEETESPIRIRVLESLLELGSSDPLVLSFYQPHLKHPSQEVRLNAAFSLLRVQPTFLPAFPVLVETLDLKYRREPSRFSNVFESLLFLGSFSLHLKPYLPQLLDILNEGDWVYLQMAVLRVLRQMENEAQSLVPLLVEKLKTLRRGEEELFIPLVQTLVVLTPKTLESEVLPLLKQRLTDSFPKEESLFDECLEALPLLKKTACSLIPYLLSLWEQSPHSLRGESILRSIARIVVRPAVQDIPLLTPDSERLILDAFIRVQGACKEELGLLLLGEHFSLKQEWLLALETHLNHQDPFWRQATFLRVQLEPFSPEAIALLQEIRESGEILWQIRATGVWIRLQKQKESAPEVYLAYHFLEKCLEQQSSFIQEAVLKELGSCTVFLEKTLQNIAPFLEVEDPFVRLAALQALGAKGVSARPLEEALLKAISSQKIEAEELEVLGQIASSRFVPLLIQSLRQEQSAQSFVYLEILDRIRTRR